MFVFSEPSQQSWVLSHKEKEVAIDKDVAIHLKTPDIIAINFLYQNFLNDFKGSIINEQDGFSTQLQISVFLNIIVKHYRVPKERFLILVVTPGYLIQKWSDRLTRFGELKVKVVDSKTCPADFDRETCLALLLPFENIKIAEVIAEYKLFSVIIDHLDVIATKLIVKKTFGTFNIGITKRNFYTDPDQKLQWTMLNWANPNSVGRLKDFYEADNDNFANLRDNYHHWWLTLTWEYSEKFKRNLDEEGEEPQLEQAKTKRKKRKPSQAKLKTSLDLESYEAEGTTDHKDEKTSNKSGSYNEESNKCSSNREQDLQITQTESKEIVTSTTLSNPVSISQGTIEYDVENVDDRKSSTSSQDTIEYDVAEIIDRKLVEKCNNHSDEDNNVLLNIIEGTKRHASVEELDYDSKVNLKKEELYSQIFNDIPVPETQNQPTDSDDFLLSLI